MATEQQIAITHRLYECRRTLRTLLGKNYSAHAEGWIDLVRKIGQGKYMDELETCMYLLQDEGIKYDGMAQMWVCAATVELIEPDDLTPARES